MPEGKLKRAAEQRSDISFLVKILMKTFLWSCTGNMLKLLSSVCIIVSGIYIRMKEKAVEKVLILRDGYYNKRKRWQITASFFCYSIHPIISKLFQLLSRGLRPKFSWQLSVRSFKFINWFVFGINIDIITLLEVLTITIII